MTDWCTVFRRLYSRELLASQEARSRWESDANRLLAERFGNETERWIRIANRFVFRRPEFNAFLLRTGLCDHPQVVMDVIKLGLAEDCETAHLENQCPISSISLRDEDDEESARDERCRKRSARIAKACRSASERWAWNELEPFPVALPPDMWEKIELWNSSEMSVD